MSGAAADIMDRITAHFSGRGMRSLSVPEWDLTVFCKPMTVAERSQLFKGSRDGGLRWQVESIVLKALDADGKKLFSPHDEIKLLHHADPYVVEKVAAFIMLEDVDLNPDEEVEAVKKN